MGLVEELRTRESFVLFVNFVVKNWYAITLKSTYINHKAHKGHKEFINLM